MTTRNRRGQYSPAPLKNQSDRRLDRALRDGFAKPREWCVTPQPSGAITAMPGKAYFAPAVTVTARTRDEAVAEYLRLVAVSA